MTDLKMNAALKGYLRLWTTRAIIKSAVQTQPDLTSEDIVVLMTDAFENGWNYQAAITPAPDGQETMQ